MAGDKRRSGRQEPAQEEEAAAPKAAPRRSGRTASATPAPEPALGKQKGGAASGAKAGRPPKSAPAKASGAKRSASPSPLPAAKKGKGGKAVSGRRSEPAEAAPAKSGGRGRSGGSEGKQPAGKAGGSKAAKGKAAAKQAAGGGKAAAARGKGWRGGKKEGEPDSPAAEEEDEEQSGEEGSGSESEEGGSGSEAEGSGSEASGSEEEVVEEEESSEEEGSEEEPASEEEEEEEEESDIDETVYAPPKTSQLPAVVPVVEADASQGLAELAVPSAAMGDLLAAYNTLRAFSWQLRLSPFSFPDFAAAMAAHQPTSLMDEVHVCMLRALCVDETPKERAEHGLDPSLLDAMTWPPYVWEFLRLTEDELAEQEWAHRATPKAQEDAAAGKKGGGRKGGGAAARKAKEAAAAAVAAASSAAGDAPRPKSFQPLSKEAQEAMDAVVGTRELAPAGGAPAQTVEAFVGAAPRPAPPAPEYYGLPLELKAAILARLCDHLLDCLTVRAEIDRRENEKEFVAGKGGSGSRWGMMSEEERKAADDKAQEEADGSHDVCVLCGSGGNLLCCDACPATYHVRCVGESNRAMGASEWLCPECRVGGRGEAAGLRIPVAARNRWKQPLHLMYGTVCRSAPPAVKSSGKHAQELEDGPIPAQWYMGEAAKKELAAATRVKGSDEPPPASSYDAVEEPPEVWQHDYEYGTGPAAYVNRYRNAWPAALANIALAVEDAKRRRGRGELKVPTGTCGGLVVTELPAPMAAVKFSWEQLQGKPAVQLTARCGKCKACLRPTLRKPCLSPVARSEEEAAAAAAENAKLAVLVRQVVRLEREFWSLAEGAWAGAEGMAFRQQWLAGLRSASSVGEVAHALLQLEAALRPLAFVDEWRGGETGGVASAAAAAADKAAGDKGPSASRPPSRTVSRAPSGADLASLAGQTSQQGELSASLAALDGTPASAAAAAAARAADPYDIRYEKVVLGGWEVNKRMVVARMHGVNRLPLALARKAARQAGWQPIPGVRYRKHRWTVTPRMQWQAATEMARTAAQLALSLRQLDPMLCLEGGERPKQEQGEPLYYASLQGKRPAASGAAPEDGIGAAATAQASPAGGFEYLLHIRPPPTPTAAQQMALATMVAEQQKALRQQERQQQQAAAQAGGKQAAAEQAAAGQANSAAGEADAGAEDVKPEAAEAEAEPMQLEAPQQVQPEQPLAPAIKQEAAEPAAMAATEPAPLPNGVTEAPQQPAPVEADPAPEVAAPAAQPAPEAAEPEVAAPAAQPAPEAAEPVVAAPAAAPEAAVATVPPAPTAEPAAAAAAAADPAAATAAEPAAAAAPAAQAAAPMEVDTALAPSAPQQPPAAAADALPAGSSQLPQASSQLELGSLATSEQGEPASEGAPASLAVTAPSESRDPAASGEEAPSGELQPGESEQELGPERKRPRFEWRVQEEEGPTEAPSAAVAAKMRRLEAERARAEAEEAERLAKMRARHSASNLAKLGSDAARVAAPATGAAPGALAAVAPGMTLEQVIREAQASRDPIWVHESLLPLWLIKAYEERLRREAANAPAREAAAAVRQAATGPDATPEAVAAARAALHEAAAAAADACGQCERYQGENEELDAAWIACDTCQRWFHCACGRAGQDDVEAMGGVDSWSCQACKMFRRQMERAAARSQRQAKPPRPFSPDEGTTKARGGRPPLPGQTKEEALALAKRGRVKATTTSEPNEEADPAELERRQKEREERIRKRREGQGASAEAEPWFCPVCKYPDRGRPLFQCAACKDSFHFECAGMHAEEYAGKASAGEEVRCLACQGKRVRAPSQAAINAAILAAQRAAGTAPSADDGDSSDFYSDEDEDEEEEGSSEGEEAPAAAGGKKGGEGGGGGQASGARLQTNRVLTPEEFILGELAKQAGGVSVHTQATWPGAAMLVLTKVLRQECAAEFSEPVDLQAFPDYAQEVAQPMDLGTVKAKLQALSYASPLDLLRDVGLVWANCAAYNADGSDIMAQCHDCRRAFETAWRLEGLPSDAATWQPAKAAELREDAARRLAALPPEQRAALTAALAGAPLPQPKPQPPRPAQPAPAPQPAPVRAPAPAPAPVAAPPQQVVVAAQAPMAAPRPQQPLKRKLPEAAPAAAAAAAADAAGGMAPPPRAPPASKRSRQPAIDQGDWQTRAAQALARLMQLEASEPFHEPVPRDVPGYHDVIKRPRCLEQIQRNLAKAKYPTPLEFLADVQLVWDNCREYNEPDAPVVAEAAEAEAYWKQCWAATGVQVSNRELEAQAAARRAAKAAAAAEKLDAAWRAAARKTLFRLQKVKESSWFWAPVRAEEAPGYFDVVRRPMDLATISDKLKSGSYGAAHEFLADVQLVWDNCLAYNGQDHAVTRDAAVTRRQFEQWWQQAGLTLDGRLASMVEEEQGPPSYPPMQQQQPQQQPQYQQAQAGWGMQAPPQQQQGYGYQQPAASQQAAPQQQAQLGALLQQLLASAVPGTAAQQQSYGYQQGGVGGGGLASNPAFQQLVTQLPPEQQRQVLQLAQALPPGEQAQFLTLLQRAAPASGQQAQQAAPPAQQFAQPQPQAGYGGGFAQAAPQQYGQQAQLNAWEQQQVAAQQQQQQQQQQQLQQEQQMQQQQQQQAAAAWPSAARQLLEALASVPNATIILQQPPPPFNQGAPVVDLTTMANRLASGQYSRPLELAADAGRMFTGFAAAYPDGSQQRAALQQLQAAFETLWQRVLAPYAQF